MEVWRERKERKVDQRKGKVGSEKMEEIVKMG